MIGSAHHLLVQYGYPGLFLLLLLGIVGLPVPDETLVTAAGFLIGRGDLRLAPTFLAALLGSICGITLSFVLGRVVGFRLINRYGHWLHLTPARLAAVHRWYELAGRWTLTLGYFVPGLRHVVALAAGTSGLSWPSFALFAYGGALLWIAALLTLGYWIGEHRESGTLHAGRVILLACAAAALAAALYLALRRTRPR